MYALGGAALLTLFSFVLRVFRIGEPNSFAFDETYYAKHGWALTHFGYARSYVDDADAKILTGQTDNLWTDTPEMIVHPEVGKWLIGAGEMIFGMDPTGWRMASAIVGSLMVLVMCRFATRVTGSVFLGLLAGFLLSLDGLHLVLSRLALLDIFLAFFMLLGVHCVVADRQWFTRRTAEAADQPVGTWGPVWLYRPWLLAAGLWFGLAVGTKWTALYPLAAFGVWAWVSNAVARRSLRVRWAVAKSALVDGVPAFLHLVGVAFVVYVLSWTGWMLNAEEYEQHLSDTQYSRFNGGGKWPSATQPDAACDGPLDAVTSLCVPKEAVQTLRSLASYHRDVWNFHTEFLNDATHTYASKPWGWLVQNRPVGVDAQLDIKPDTEGCGAAADSSCLRQVLLLGNPILWWGGCVALVASLVLWVGRRDWRFGVPVVGVAATWLPWLRYDDRTIFLFYAIAILPFVVLSLTLCIGALLGPTLRASTRRTVGAVVSGVFVGAVVLAFGWFWPIWTDQLITHGEWMRRMWLKSWI
ncbi:phospholipid carrier-dependent glycosyltransferase [Nocardioides jishulii]|uniref:Polyprenol-phosphate-mannose--protein mannosyltransferase n=2 Tax=Nocardioides jishulii TaxID=2575440 RepID=A0A4U2YTQ3_9ACTN|nr:phospholipid carrier-dependent glycosyltransferase [Nocardioides jishulii]TKI64936.1 phospholipid carrier-dependent glycosyltransferase [Nocardioides jishulii]